MRMKIFARAEDRSWWKPFEASVADVSRDDPLKHQMEHFGRVVRGEAEPIVSARDGLQNLRITEAIVKAAKTGLVVDTTQTDSQLPHRHN
jgi:predicted dehydrogenase